MNEDAQGDTKEKQMPLSPLSDLMFVPVVLRFYFLLWVTNSAKSSSKQRMSWREEGNKKTKAPAESRQYIFPWWECAMHSLTRGGSTYAFTKLRANE